MAWVIMLEGIPNRATVTSGLATCAFKAKPGLLMPLGIQRIVIFSVEGIGCDEPLLFTALLNEGAVNNPGSQT